MTVYLDMGSLDYLRRQLLESAVDDESEMPANTELIGFNSVITPLKNRTAQTDQQKKKKKKNYLTAAQNRKNRLRAREEMNDVLSYFCLDKGCLQARSEVYLHFGELDFGDEVAKRDKCFTQCPICTGDWSKTFMPVVKQHVREFFRSGVGTGSYPLSTDDKKKVSKPLWDSDYWKEKVFDRASGIKRVTVDALYFSLVAAGMIDVVRREGKLVWSLVRDDNDQTLLEDDAKWVGINTFPLDHVPRRNPTLNKESKSKKSKKSKKSRR